MDPRIKEKVFTHHSNQIDNFYTKLSRIGEGAYGIVFKAQSKDKSAKFFAIKQLKTTRPGVGVPSDAYREFKILRELRHENIVKLERVFLRPQDNEIDLVYHYAEYDLIDILRHHRQRSMICNIRIIKSVLFQMLKGVSFLHKNWVMHRDIKPANILIMGDRSGETGRVKIGDFGLARIFQSPPRPLSEDGEVVTIWYRAPELILGSKHYTRAVDIWAIGCIFAEMLRGDPIFPGTEEKGKRVLQTNQMKRITSVLGKPTARDWPDIVHCTHYPTVADWSGFDCDLFTRLSSAHSSPSPSSTMYSSPYDTLSSPKSPLSPSPSSPSAFTSLSATRMCQKVPLLRSNMRAFDLLIQMLHYDPTKRITAEKAMKHEFFAEHPLPHKNALMEENGKYTTYATRDIYLANQKKKRAVAFAGANANNNHSSTRNRNYDSESVNPTEAGCNLAATHQHKLKHKHKMRQNSQHALSSSSVTQKLSSTTSVAITNTSSTSSNTIHESACHSEKQNQRPQLQAGVGRGNNRKRQFYRGSKNSSLGISQGVRKRAK